MKYLNLITATALALSSVGCQHDVVGPARVTDANFAAVSSTEVVERVIATTKFVPCANGGLGEDVSLSGSFHDTIHATLDGSGGAHVLVMHAPAGAVTSFHDNSTPAHRRPHTGTLTVLPHGPASVTGALRAGSSACFQRHLTVLAAEPFAPSRIRC